MREWGNHSFLSKLLICSLFANFFAKNKQFAQKTNKQISNPICILITWSEYS